MNKNNAFWLQRTLEHARTVPPVAGARVAAMLLVGKVWHIGFNSLKTHPLMAKFGKNDKAICLHAEVNSIARALRWNTPERLEGSTMYIARAKADGSAGMAKPCEGCQRAIVTFGINSVHWTENENCLP
jgi:tRNA(Arg) A34 adenosine deaminase TadA